MELDAVTEKNVKMWLEGDVDEESKSEIRRLMETHPQKIIDAFYTELAFGTGGLRGVMGIGTNRMNRYTVRMATQGLANYLAQQPAETDRHAVIIGYDSRSNSRYFAEEAAKVLAGNGIQVFLFKELRPTPLVSFGCRFKRCSAAIMVTASHNPPEYNGYKVYWEDGGQVVPPHDKGIIEEVKKIDSLNKVRIAKDTAHPLIEILGDELDEEYLKAIKPYQSYPKENAEKGSTLKVVYTSLHGTGVTLVPRTLKEWGFTNVRLVEEQCVPNGDFPTVKSPNPEEREALQLGIQEMMHTNADILIATDPDADRMGVAVRHEGEIRMLNGNQIACLCLYHICEALTSQGRMPKNAAFVKTIATTELFKTIAESFGGYCFDVLTGFKYVAEKIRSWEKEEKGFQYIFGGEESYGYLLGTHARDKDAVICSALICEVALHAKLQGKTLYDLLYEIYKKYGVYFEQLTAITFDESKKGREQMSRGMEKLQTSPPKKVLGTEVDSIENYLVSIKTNLRTGEKSPLSLPKANALLLRLEDRTKILIRPSGTEPKIKIYCGVIEPQTENINRSIEAAKNRSNKLLAAIEDLLK